MSASPTVLECYYQVRDRYLFPVGPSYQETTGPFWNFLLWGIGKIISKRYICLSLVMNQCPNEAQQQIPSIGRSIFMDSLNLDVGKSMAYRLKTFLEVQDGDGKFCRRSVSSDRSPYNNLRGVLALLGLKQEREVMQVAMRCQNIFRRLPGSTRGNLTTQ